MFGNDYVWIAQRFSHLKVIYDFKIFFSKEIICASKRHCTSVKIPIFSRSVVDNGTWLVGWLTDWLIDQSAGRLVDRWHHISWLYWDWFRGCQTKQRQASLRRVYLTNPLKTLSSSIDWLFMCLIPNPIKYLSLKCEKCGKNIKVINTFARHFHHVSCALKRT